ncbi:hypothetical protein ACFX2B_013635 [Malus domestica]
MGGGGSCVGGEGGGNGSGDDYNNVVIGDWATVVMIVARGGGGDGTVVMVILLGVGNIDAIDESFFKWISCSCKCIKELSLRKITGIRSITIESSSLERAPFREGSTPVQFDNLFDLDMSIRSFSDELVPAVASGFDMEYWKLQNLDFIHHIEEVTVDLFDGSNGIEFARYIIENAKNLEQMVISHLPEQCDVRQKLNESKMMML